MALRLDSACNGNVQEKHVYICTRVDMRALVMSLERHGKRSIIRILKEEASIRRFGLLSGPLRIGVLGDHDYSICDSLSEIEARNLKCPRVAIINPWANAVGDSVGTLSVVREIQRQFRYRGVTAQFDLLQAPCKSTDFYTRPLTTDAGCRASQLQLEPYRPMTHTLIFRRGQKQKRSRGLTAR